MKTNKDFRKFGDNSRGGEYVKGKFPLKEKKSKRSIYYEIDEDVDIGYSNFRKKESIEDYFDDYANEEFDKEFYLVDKDYDEDEY
jgi:hypothetical protein